jgi:hypothetical protein
MSGFRIEGDASGNVAEVNAAKELTVASSLDSDAAGFSTISMEHDSGYVTGTRDIAQADGSTDYRLRVGMDTIFDNDVFNYAAQNTARHQYYNTTMTAAWGSGFLTTNSGSIATTTTGVRVSTNRTFPIYGASDLWFEFTAAFAGSWTPTNTVIDVGGFLSGTSTPYTPTDGVFFRIDSSGIRGVLSYAGSETQTDVFVAVHGGSNWSPTLGTVYKFGIGVNNELVQFWINDTLMAKKIVPSGNGAPISCGAVPFAVRHANTGTASAAMQLKIADYTVSLGDLQSNKDWGHSNSGMGLSANQGQSGGTMGSTTSVGNSSAIPTTAAGSNTTANVSGLGGLGQITAPAAAATDFIATSYLNPAAASGQTGRVLYITGVTISSINYGAAVATTPTTLLWQLAFGHTGVSLATAEATNGKAPRKIMLGFQSAIVATPVGAVYNPSQIWVPFPSAIVVNPGEYIATVVRVVVGTATSSQTIVYSVGFDGYFE